MSSRFSFLLANRRERRVDPVSGFTLVKCGRRQGWLDDRISNLPDEVLVSIVSRLDTEQQARTSVLARRWRYLWRLTRGLKFEIRNWFMLDCTDGLLDVRCPAFVDMVSHVLKLHRSETIDELSVIFCLDDENFKSDIDGWISFAFQKRVKRIQLNFSCGWTNANWKYPLSDANLRNYRLDSLTSLHLCHVNVTEEGIGYILSVCPFLEDLAVLYSKPLVNFIVSGPSLKLKYLEIGYCVLDSVNIYDVNLVSFRYRGAMPRTRISFKDTPYLVKAYFVGPYARYIVKNSVQELSYLPRLETLGLDVSLTRDVEHLNGFPKFPKLRNLRQVELKLSRHVSCNLLCTHLLRAAPLLSRLKIEFWSLNDSGRRLPKVRRRKRQHKCLKVVELVGFVGCRVDLAVAFYMLKKAASLEKIIIDPFQPNKWEFAQDLDKQEVARTRARQHLESRLPVGTELVVL